MDNDRGINYIKRSDVLKQCNKEVPLSAVEELVDVNLDDSNTDDQCRVKRGLTGDLKKMLNTITSMKLRETASNRINALGSTIVELEGSSVNLKKSMTSALFSTEIDLLERCGNAAKETMHTLRGVNFVDPQVAGNSIRSNLDDLIYEDAELNMMEIDGEEINELMMLSDDESDSDDDVDIDFINADPSTSDKDMFGHRLIHLDKYMGRLAQRAKAKRKELFDVNTAGEVLKARMAPALWESCDHIEFLLPLVDIENVEHVKRVRKTEPKKEKAELVKLTDKAQATVTAEEVSITKELDHVRRSLRSVLKTTDRGFIEYYRVVIDPDSFSKTVENMFNVSYLIRDKVVFLKFHGDGVPYLYSASKLPEAEKTAFERDNRHQGIVSLSQQQWMKMKHMLKITKACIPAKDL